MTVVLVGLEFGLELHVLVGLEFGLELQSKQYNRQPSKKNNKYHLFVPSDDGPRYARNM